MGLNWSLMDTGNGKRGRESELEMAIMQRWEIVEASECSTASLLKDIPQHHSNARSLGQRIKVIRAK